MLQLTEIQALAEVENRLEAAISASEYVTPETLAATLYGEAIRLPDAQAIGTLAATATLLENLPSRRAITAEWLKRFRQEHAPALLEVLDVRLQAAQSMADACESGQRQQLAEVGVEWSPNARWSALQAIAGRLGHLRHEIETGQAGPRAMARLLTEEEPQTATEADTARADEVIARRANRFSRA